MKRVPDHAGRNGRPPLSNWAICAALALGTIILYVQVAGHDFIRLDDEGYVTDNVHVKSGLSWQTIRWAFVSTEQANWHPLTWLSHAADCQIFGLWAGGHHLTSVLIHVVNSILLFLLLRQATRKPGPSFLVAALFAWHPLNVESVAWVAERKNVLSTLFFLLALGAYGWYVQRPAIKRYLVVATFFLMSLASKPMVVTFPFVLLLVDFWPLQRVQGWTVPSTVMKSPQWPAWRLAIEKLPFLLLSAASSVVTMVAQRDTIAAAENLPLRFRIVNALYSYAMYTWKMIWPSGLALYYPHPFVATPNRTPDIGLYIVVAIGAILLIGGSLLAWRQRSTRPYLLTGWFWYVGTLVPVIGIVQVGMQAMADRYAYIPLVGLFAIFIWGATELSDHLKLRPGYKATGVAIVMTGLWIVCFQQIEYWKSSYDIWAHTLEVTEDNFVADDNMGDALMRLGRPDSINYFQDAARIAPHDGVSHGAVGAYLEDQGRMQEAIEEFEVVLRNPPSARFLAFAYANLGIIYTELGDPDRARAAFQHSLETDRPALTEMSDNLARTASAHPVDEAYVRLGLLLEQTGRLTEARTALNRAMELNPNRRQVQIYLTELDSRK